MSHKEPSLWAYHVLRVFVPPWRWYFHCEIYGEQHFARTGPLLLAANHASYLDPWFIGTRTTYRTTRFLINAQWYDRSAIWRFLFRSWGVIPAAPGRPKETVRRVAEALRRGHSVCIFPEGKISTNGELQPGRRGIGYMAAASGVPVTPCYLEGTFDVLPKHLRFPRRAPVSLHVGPPIPFPGSPTDEPGGAEVSRFVGRVMDAIRALKPENPTPTG